MKFSQLSSTCIVPTLSRLVLALAFIPAGYDKMMTKSEFDGAQAATLANLGVTVERIAEQSRTDGTGGSVILADFRQDAAGEEGGGPPAPEETVEPDAAADQPAPVSDDAPAGPPSAVRYTAASMHNVTLLCHGAGWPAPQRLALLAAITEFVGGLLLVLGFLSRVWGFGLAISMGVAFYLVSMRLNGVISMGPFKAAADIAKFNAMFAQLGLLVLAFGVFLTGPGPLSLDRMLFRRDSGRTGKSDLDVPGGERASTLPLAVGRPM